MMLELKNLPTPIEALGSRDDLNIGGLVGAARLFVVRRYKLIFIVAISVMLGGLAYLKTTPPTYTASASIDILNREAEYLHQQATLAEPPIDMLHEVAIAKSSAVAEAAVRKLRLDQDPEFNVPGGGLVTKLKNLWLGSPPDTEFLRLRSAIVAVQGKTRVAGEAGGTSFQIDFTSYDPVKAADIANELAQAFISLQTDADSDVHKKANDWLLDQSNEMRRRVDEAESAVADFKKKYNIVTVDGKLLDQQKLEDLNARVAAAKDKKIDAQYKFDKIAASVASVNTRDILDVTSAPEVLQDPVIEKSRERYLDLRNQVTALQRNFGKDSQKLSDIMAATKVEMTTELSRLAESAGNDLQLASKHYDDLVAELKADSAASHDTSYLEAQLKELEGTAANYRTLYENFLQHSAGSIQEVSFPFRAAQISEQATPPSEKSWPKSPIVLAAACIGGLGLGAAVGLLRDFADRTFRTGRQFEAATRMRCVGLIPRAQMTKESARAALVPLEVSEKFGDPRRTPLWWKIKGNPNSRYVSELMAVGLAVRGYANTHGARVFGVTSALPGEGKSTLVGSLGVLMAQSGHKIAVVDLDFRHTTLTDGFAPRSKLGLPDFLEKRCDLKDVMLYDARLDVTVVPGGSRLNVLRPVEMLTSARLRECINKLRANFDYVLVDLPPLIPVSDVRATSEYIEGYLLVAEWAKTNPALFTRALESCPEIAGKFIGGILTKVNFKTLSKYDSLATQYYMKPEYQRYRDPD